MSDQTMIADEQQHLVDGLSIETALAGSLRANLRTVLARHRAHSPDVPFDTADNAIRIVLRQEAERLSQ